MPDCLPAKLVFEANRIIQQFRPASAGVHIVDKLIGSACESVIPFTTNNVTF
jgi:hypothetical protein